MALQAGFVRTFSRAVAHPIFRAGLGQKTLLRAARRMTGLTGLEPWGYEDGFQILLESLERDAGLSTIGRWSLRRTLLYALASRQLLAEYSRHHAPAPVTPPIVITGLPRTGTTFLHRLLAQDPRFHAPQLWNLMQPLPRHRFDSPLLRQWRFRVMLTTTLPFLSNIDARHFLRTSEPEECMFAMAQSFCSMLFWTQAPVYRYLDWYQNVDKRAKYQQYATLLPLLNAAAPARRLLLKAPEHLGSVDHVAAMVPGTVIVQTHRDPVTAFASFASLLRGTHELATDRPDHPRAARATLEWLALEARRNAEARRTMPPVLDLSYDLIAGHPMAAAEAIYRFASLELPAATRASFQRFIAANPQGKRGVHRYSAAETGIAESDIVRAFEGYGPAPA